MAEIRRVGPGDAALLDCVADDVFDGQIKAAYLGAYLAESRNLMVVAVQDGAVIGQARSAAARAPGSLRRATTAP